MVRDEYLPNTRTTLAAAAMPDGEAFYQAQIEKHTTLTLTPEQIHDIGLAEVARIQAEMEAIKKQANFTGTMTQFFEFLRTDPQFYARTPRELLSYSAYGPRRPTGGSARPSGSCRGAGTASARFPTRWRPSTRAAAAGSRPA
jgi:uncharacterized protein (DUF885 family)